jgi:hypothetical protein
MVYLFKTDIVGIGIRTIQPKWTSQGAVIPKDLNVTLCVHFLFLPYEINEAEALGLLYEAGFQTFKQI